MTTIIQDRLDSGAQVSLEMDKNEGELFVFHCPAGQGCKVSKWPLDSYHMPIAMAHYEQCLELERAAFEACSKSALHLVWQLLRHIELGANAGDQHRPDHTPMQNLKRTAVNLTARNAHHHQP